MRLLSESFWIIIQNTPTIFNLFLVDTNIVEEPREKKVRWDQPEDVIKKILDARQLLLEYNGNTSQKISSNE